MSGRHSMGLNKLLSMVAYPRARPFSGRVSLCMLLICSGFAAEVSDAKSLQLPQMGLVEAVRQAEKQLAAQHVGLDAYYLARGEWIGAEEELTEPYWLLTWQQRASAADSAELRVAVDRQGKVQVVPQDAICHDAAMRRPPLDAIDYIYALDSFDIPDQPALLHPHGNTDSDGIRDRPRIVIWRNGEPLPDVPDKFAWTQSEILNLLSDRYHCVTEAVWRHQYHHIAEHVDGGIVLKSGEIIGWLLRFGGLGRLQFGYDPRAEKVTSWRFANEPATRSRWLHLAREKR